MRTHIRTLAVLSVLALCACTSTKQFAHSDFQPPQGEYRLLVMEPDIRVSLLTTGGVMEPREDWTLQARENVIKALIEQQAGRGGETRVVTSREELGGDPARLTDLIWLHKAVGNSILIHKYMGVSLPTKKDRFDWTLGDEAVALGAATNYDYALFLYAEDSFSSGGRVALQMAGALGCIVGACIIPSGGYQLAFASLVDLKTGRVAWYNVLASSVGDIRTPEGAKQMVNTLLSKMQPGKSEPKRTRS
ncbi:MAG TPA: hypothetical protein VIL32_18105 [Steroidobacteraceae bacterium]